MVLLIIQLVLVLPFFLARRVYAACCEILIIRLVKLNGVHLTMGFTDRTVKCGVVVDVAALNTIFIRRVKHLNLVIDVRILTGVLLVLTRSVGHKASIKVL